MEEEAKCLYGTNFSYAERDFITNKLLKVTPNISQEVVNQSIAFLERQRKPIVLVPSILRREDMNG